MKSPEKTAFEIILIIVVMLSIVLLPLAAEAQHGQGPPSFAEFDTNGDGFISEEELNAGRAARMAAMAKEGRQMKGAATHPAFTDLDTDGDGGLSEAEFLAGRQAHMKTMRGSGHGHGKGMHQGKGMKMPAFQDLDLDSDGCINAEEFADHQAKMHGKAKPDGQPKTAAPEPE